MSKKEAIEFVVKNSVTNVTPGQVDEVIDLLQKLGMVPPRTKLANLNIEDNAWEDN
jgi:hypothetical protein